MNRPPEPGQPWWARPGGAPLPGQPAPRYAPPPPPPARRPMPPPRPMPPRPMPPRSPVPQPTPPPTRHRAPQPASQRRNQLLISAGAVVFVAVVVVVTLWYAGFFTPGSGNVLDVRQAEAGVRQILSDPINGYGANNVEAVKCNEGRDPVVVAGEGFPCQVVIDGAVRDVQVVFRDDAGTYEVDGPR
ncbi:DUF4333 domain-containing protein [Mycolicibacterium phlei]